MTEEVAAVGESAEEFTEKSRLRSLFTARDEAADAIREAPLREFKANHTEPGVQVVGEHVKAAVTAYVIECEPLFQNTELGQSYWADYELRPIAIPSAPEEMHFTFRSEKERRKIGGVPDSMINHKKNQIELSGVGDYISLSTPIAVTWEGTTHKGAKYRQETESTIMGVPRSVSVSVFRATNRLLADLEIGLDAEQITDKEASYDYSDLV